MSAATPESARDAPEPHERGSVFSLYEVVKRNTDKETWLVISGCIYDITRFHSEHPSGEEVLLEQAGRDMLDQYLIGVVHPCDHNPNASRFWTVWLIPVLGAVVLGLMYHYYLMDGKSS
uniref:Cytochrome b5 heme-binding domain-containing protein n=1 Tax=Podarcis muralis TaxID=64176 RepID=A0A670JC10_PODMU